MLGLWRDGRQVVTTVENIADGIQPGDVYIGRAGRGFDGYFGNPFTIGDRTTKIAKYRFWFQDRIAKDAEFRARIEGLRGKRLVCFCKPLRCHGDVIVEFLEG